MSESPRAEPRAAVRPVRSRSLVTAVLAFCLLGLLAPSAAHATVSAGASYACDSEGHCVWGYADSVNAGGRGAAVCYGGSNGATLLTITCSVGGNSTTTSLPGPSGASAVTGPVSDGPRKVCWTVTGYFQRVTGGIAVVTTSGCALVVV